MMKDLLFAVFAISLCSITAQAQHLDVEGDARISGKLNVINAIGDSSIYIGAMAGMSDTTELGTNIFIGTQAGKNNTSGKNNTFMGGQAGSTLEGSSFNSLFGYQAGLGFKSGGDNSFFGHAAGKSPKMGIQNSFLGASAGFNSTGWGNTYIGAYAGSGSNVKLNRGSQNTFVGSGAKNENQNDSLNLAIALGYGALVNCNQCAVIGGTGSQAIKLGIGTTTPEFDLSIHDGVLNSSIIQLSTSEEELQMGLSQGVAYLRTQSNDDLNIGTNNSTRMSILASGEVGIGTTNPSHELEVFDADNSGSATVRIGSSALMLDITSQTSSANILTKTNHPLELGANNSSFLFLNSNQRVGIGTNDPQSDLHLKNGLSQILVGDAGCSSGTFGGVGFASSLDCSNYSILGNGAHTIVNAPEDGTISFRLNNSNKIIINADGTLRLLNLASAGTTPLCRNSNGDIAPCSSSIRYKKNISDYKPDGEILKKLRPVAFNWIDSDAADIGLIAEEVAAIDPRLIVRNEKGAVEGVKYDRISILLIDFIKNQEIQIKEMAREIEALKKINASKSEVVLSSELELFRDELASLRAQVSTMQK